MLSPVSMLSFRIKRILSNLINFGQKLGSCSFLADKNLHVKVLNDPGAQKKLVQCYNSIILWALASFAILIKHYLSRNLNRFSLTFFFWFAGIVATICYSITRWFQNDFVKLINWLTDFLRRYQGNCLNYYATTEPNYNASIKCMITF